MNPMLVIWIAAPILVLVFALKDNGIEFLLTPAGALLATCAVCFVGLPFGGWEFVFRRLMPAVLLVGLSFLVFNGLKGVYCATFGADTAKCIDAR